MDIAVFLQMNIELKCVTVVTCFEKPGPGLIDLLWK